MAIAIGAARSVRSFSTDCRCHSCRLVALGPGRGRICPRGSISRRLCDLDVAAVAPRLDACHRHGTLHHRRGRRPARAPRRATDRACLCRDPAGRVRINFVLFMTGDAARGYGAFEVHDSSWIRRLERMNSVHEVPSPRRVLQAAASCVRVPRYDVRMRVRRIRREGCSQLHQRNRAGDVKAPRMECLAPLARLRLRPASMEEWVPPR